MSRSLLKLLFLFITAVPLLAQKKYNFDQVCERTSVQVDPKEIPKALKTADSLYMKAQKPLDKVKSLLLSAELYHSSGEFKKSLCYGENAHSMLNQIDDAEWQSRVNRFLAKEYRLVGLFERSKKYTRQGMEAAKRITDFQEKGEILGLLSQEMAYYEIEQSSYPEAVKYIEQSLNFFGKDDQDNKRAVAASYQILGDIYLKLKDYTASENHYRKAESLLKTKCCVLGLVYNGLGGIRLKQKNWKDAEFYLKKAENIADSSKSLKLKKAVYSNINDFYEGTGDSFKASLYALKYVRAYDDLTATNRELIFKSPEAPVKPSKKNAQISIVKNTAIVVLLAALVAILVFFRKKQKKQRAKFRNIIRTQLQMIGSRSQTPTLKTEISDFSNISVEEVDDRAGEDDKRKNESLMMTSETETKLLELLEEFEKGELYNNKNMSLSFLAAELNTNTKYLSYVINRHKSADVKTYVNRLRINYIVDKLINDDKYRQYKISILADECGFSSHSKFASVFKAVTDFSPSAYIKYLDSGNQPDKNAHFHENN